MDDSWELYVKLLLSGKISKTYLVPLKARTFSGSTLIEWGLKMPEMHKAWKALCFPCFTQLKQSSCFLANSNNRKYTSSASADSGWFYLSVPLAAAWRMSWMSNRSARLMPFPSSIPQLSWNLAMATPASCTCCPTKQFMNCS